MKKHNIFIDELKKEVQLLESWIATTETGCWSTHLQEPMKKRVLELKALLLLYKYLSE